MNEAFLKWLNDDKWDKRKPALQDAWEAAEAHLREPMACGHPRACLAVTWDEDAARGEESGAGCLACETAAKVADDLRAAFNRPMDCCHHPLKVHSFEACRDKGVHQCAMCEAVAKAREEVLREAEEICWTETENAEGIRHRILLRIHTFRTARSDQGNRRGGK